LKGNRLKPAIRDGFGLVADNSQFAIHNCQQYRRAGHLSRTAFPFYGGFHATISRVTRTLPPAWT